MGLWSASVESFSVSRMRNFFVKASFSLKYDELAFDKYNHVSAWVTIIRKCKTPLSLFIEIFVYVTKTKIMVILGRPASITHSWKEITQAGICLCKIGIFLAHIFKLSDFCFRWTLFLAHKRSPLCNWSLSLSLHKTCFECWVLHNSGETPAWNVLDVPVLSILKHFTEQSFLSHPLGNCTEHGRDKRGSKTLRKVHIPLSKLVKYYITKTVGG